jgi:hypothetical protein
MGTAEVIRPVLRAAGADVEPGVIESALGRPSTHPQKASMLKLVQDIPALSPQEISSRRIPHGPVAQVAAQKYQMAQEMEKIKTLVNGRNLEDLSPAEQEQYGRLLGRVQTSAREIRRVWEKEVDHKLGPAYQHVRTDPVQVLKDQIAENLSRGSGRGKDLAQIIWPDDGSRPLGHLGPEFRRESAGVDAPAIVVGSLPAEEPYKRPLPSPDPSAGPGPVLS